jgi:hypothetical protein
VIERLQTKLVAIMMPAEVSVLAAVMSYSRCLDAVSSTPLRHGKRETQSV